MFGTKSKKGMSSIGSFQLSQLNSGSVQAQLKAAGIDTISADAPRIPIRTAPSDYKLHEMTIKFITSLLPGVRCTQISSALKTL